MNSVFSTELQVLEKMIKSIFGMTSETLVIVEFLNLIIVNSIFEFISVF